ncbi:unnamed protein product [Closterium sp. NIES-65]|nr:unnamed protein product [Closterium sp. NIES-65]
MSLSSLPHSHASFFPSSFACFVLPFLIRMLRSSLPHSHASFFPSSFACFVLPYLIRMLHSSLPHSHASFPSSAFLVPFLCIPRSLPLHSSFPSSALLVPFLCTPHSLPLISSLPSSAALLIPFPPALLNPFLPVLRIPLSPCPPCSLLPALRIPFSVPVTELLSHPLPHLPLFTTPLLPSAHLLWAGGELRFEPGPWRTFPERFGWTCPNQLVWARFDSGRPGAVGADAERLGQTRSALGGPVEARKSRNMSGLSGAGAKGRGKGRGKKGDKGRGKGRGKKGDKE